MVDDPESPLFGEPVPDLRGLFVRGATDPDLVKEKQGSNVQSHSHAVDVSGTSVASKKIKNHISEPYLVPNSKKETGFHLTLGGYYRVSRNYNSLEVSNKNRRFSSALRQY